MQTLTIEGFRSYDRCELSLDEQATIHVFLGPNGSGKSNIVEAVSYLSLARSCLRVSPDIALRWGATFFRIRADLRTDAGELRSAEFVFQQQPERASACFVQDVRTPVVRFLGQVPSVTFLPQDLDLFTTAPAERRAFLDALIAQLDPAYVPLRMRFERTVKQRNALLRRIDVGEAPEEDLVSWDAAYAESGAAVERRRLELVKDLGGHVPAALASLGAPWERVSLSLVRATEGETEADIAASIHALLRARRTKDIPAGSTTAGPHRDDWILEVDGHPCGPIASRGQQRTAFLALLFVSVDLLTSKRGERPILLLDDVFSELDAAHQAALLAHCEHAQTMITAAHVVPELRHAAAYDVGRGSIVPRS